MVPPWRYLREIRRYTGTIPATLGYLPPRTPDHHHALIAAIGLAHECLGAEPVALAIAPASVMGVHLVLLKPDGSGKAAGVESKSIVGKGATGWPICLAPVNDLLGLAITEGIEDALSIHEATGVGAWAAGCANRLPALATNVPAYIDTVTVSADDDEVGTRNALQLRDRLRARGLHVETRTIGQWRAAV